jgi:hypothetical protein
LHLADFAIGRPLFPARGPHRRSGSQLLSSVAELPVQFSDDAKHKQQAEKLLEEISDR